MASARAVRNDMAALRGYVDGAHPVASNEWESQKTPGDPG
jgi:hypothetical protein